MEGKRIVCDVIACRNNRDGCACGLKCVKVTCDCADCTCCGSFEHRQED